MVSRKRQTTASVIFFWILRVCELFIDNTENHRDTRLVQQHFNTLKSKTQTYMMFLNPTNWEDCIPVCGMGVKIITIMCEQ